MIGTTLGHYKIAEKIGRGGMGEVYLAHDLHLERDVAVKVLPAHTFDDVAARKRFRKEALALSKLNHPNIASVYDFDSQDGTDFLVMEYVPGETLRARLELAPLPEVDLLDLGTQLMEGLKAAHAEGVVHRDLKPGNIQVTEDGRLKILDFGLAKLVSAPDEAAKTETMTAGVVGTVAYMSPEQLRGQLVDVRTDLYAAGAILYEMATAQPRYAEAQGADLIAAILHRDPLPPSSVRGDISRDLEAVVLKCLAMDPDSRYQTAAELQDELERLRQGMKVTAKRPASPWRRWAMGVAVVLVSLVAFNVGGIRDLLTGQRGSGTDTLRPNTVAIFPFRMSGSPDLAYLGAGMVDLLYPLLDGAGELRSIEPARLFRLVREQEVDIGDPDAARRVSTALGASLFILGNLVEIGNQVRISATFYDHAGQTLKTTSVTADGEADLGAKVDELAKNLLQGRVPEDELPPGLDTNVQALRAYMQGQVHYRAGNFEDAARSFEASVEADSLFAHGWYQLSNAYNFGAGGREKVLSALERTIQLKDRLPEITARVAQADYYGLTEVSYRADELLREVLAAHPDDANAWWSLGDVFFHSGPLRGEHMGESQQYFEQAREFGYSSQHDLIGHLSVAELVNGDVAGYVEKTEWLLEVDPDNDFAGAMRVELAILQGDEEERSAALAEIAQGNERYINMAIGSCVNLIRGPTGMEGARRCAELLLSPNRPARSQANGQILLAHLDLAEGRWNEARTRLQAVGGEGSFQALKSLAVFSIAPFLEANEVELVALLRELGAWDPDQDVPKQADEELFEANPADDRIIREYLIGLLQARLGRNQAAEAVARGLAGPAGGDNIATWEQALAHGLRAEIALQNGDWESAAEHIRWRPVKVFWGDTYASAFHSMAKEHYLRAVIFQQLGDLEEALRWYQTVAAHAAEDIIYRAPAFYESGRIQEDLGRPQEAVASYEEFIELWKNCDPELRPRLEEARRRIHKIRN